MSDLQITYRTPEALSENTRNARTHSPRQIRQIARSITAFGFRHMSKSTRVRWTASSSLVDFWSKGKFFLGRDFVGKNWCRIQPSLVYTPSSSDAEFHGRSYVANLFLRPQSPSLLSKLEILGEESCCDWQQRVAWGLHR